MLVHLTPRERLGYACLAGLILFGSGYVGLQHLRRPAPLVLQNGPVAPESTAAQPIAGAPSKASEPAGEVVVHVVGAVNAPSLVRLSAGARVMDAIAAAGGAKPDANLEELNLAAKLVDGSQLRVPAKSERARSRSRPAPPPREISIPPAGVEFPDGNEPRYVAELAEVPPPAYAAPPDSGYSPGARTRSSSGGSSSSPRKGDAPREVNVNTAGASELEALPGIGPALAQRIIEYRERHGPFTSVDALLAVRGIGPKKLEDMRPFVRL